MALTEIEQQAWLSDDSHRIVLIDMQCHDGTGFGSETFSSYPYIMPVGDSYVNILGDTVSNVSYDDIVKSVPNIASSISSDTSVGRIILVNSYGEYDRLIDDTTSFEGHPITISIGESSWVRDDFITIIEGVIDNVSAPSIDKIEVAIKDKKGVLDVNMQTDLIDTTFFTTFMDAAEAGTDFADNIVNGSGTRTWDRTKAVLPEATINTPIPLCLGKCFNIEPVIIDCYNHIYFVHEGLIESFDQVRANGVLLQPPNARKMILATGTGDYVLGEVITDDDDSTIFGTIYDISGSSPTQTVYYYIDDETKDFGAGTGTFTGSIGSFVATAVASTDESQYEVDLSLAAIRLLVHDGGSQITCDVTGQDGRSALVGGGAAALTKHSSAYLIEWLLLEKTSLVWADICQDTFPASGSEGFDNISIMGYYSKDEETVLNSVTKIISSVGGFLRFTKPPCLVQIIKFIDPVGLTPDVYIVADDVVKDGLSINKMEEPKKSLTIGYKKNWKVQDAAGLAGMLTSDNFDFLDELTTYITEYSTLAKDTTILDAQYPLAEDQEIIESVIFNESDAQAELDRRVLLRNIKRYVYSIRTVTTPFINTIGDIVHITHSRYGFLDGREALIIGMDEDPVNKRVTMEVWL